MAIRGLAFCCSPLTLLVDIHHFAAVAGAELRQNFIYFIAQEASRAVAEQPVAAARMKAPEMNLVAQVVVVAGLEADLGGGTGIGDTRSDDRNGVVADTGGITEFPNPQSHAPHPPAAIAAPAHP